MPDPLDIEDWIAKLRQDVAGYVQWIQDYDVRPVAIEYPFVSCTDYPYGGSIDLIAEITTDAKKGKREIVLVDYKSSRNDPYDSYFQQTFAYMRGWNECNPKQKVGRFFIYHPKAYKLPLGKTVKPYKFEEATDEPACLKWDLLLQIYYASGAPKLDKYSDFGSAPITKETKFDSMIIEIDPLSRMNQEEPNAKGKNKKSRE
jgi:hypothetical protein